MYGTGSHAIHETMDYNMQGWLSEKSSELFEMKLRDVYKRQVWSMIKYGNANIDYYTGTLGISIPIYTYKDNNFEIPISIDYASSGFQPGSPSGLVGQGWYLNFGGAITREVRGIPDDAIQEMYDWREKADQEMNEIPWWDKYTFPNQGSYIYGHSVRIDGYAQSYFKTTPTDSLNIVYTGAAGRCV